MIVLFEIVGVVVLATLVVYGLVRFVEYVTRTNPRAEIKDDGED